VGTYNYNEEHDKILVDKKFDEFLAMLGSSINQSGSPNKIVYIDASIEAGENPAEGRFGTHFHLMVCTKQRTRLSAARAKFTGCDVRPCRGSLQDCANYLDGHKKNGFVQPLRRETVGTAPPEKRQGAGSHHLDEIKAAIEQGATMSELENTFFGDFVRYGSSLRELYMSLTQRIVREQVLETYCNVVWNSWQTSCLDLIKSELETPNNRAIHWWWDQTGNVGKSFLAGFLQLKYNALVIEAGRKADLAYTLSNALSAGSVPIVVCDFVRTTQPTEQDDSATSTTNNFLHNVFAFLESVKNGRILVTKYQSRSIVFKAPMVLCFGNWKPPTETMSADRWKIVEIKNLVLQH
jgi:hypothetical protein